MKSSKKNSLDFGCTPVNSGCINYTGKGNTALGVSTGDCLNAVMYSIMTALEDAVDTEDFSELEIQCLLDSLGQQEPVNRTLSVILQILIDSDCRLYALVDEIIKALDNTNYTPNVELKCLRVVDGLGNTIPLSQDQLFQLLINNVCILLDAVSSLDARLSGVEGWIKNFKPQTYTEPVVVTCLTPATGATLSRAFSLHSEVQCEYNKTLGTTEELQKFLGKLDTVVIDFYKTVSGFNVKPATVADQLNNQAIIINDLFNRLNETEGCCAKDCDAISIGFGLEFVNGNLVFIFNNLYGTKIPNGYTDCGTTFTIRDKSGGVVTGNLTISNDYTSDEISLLTLKKNDLLTIDVNTKLCDGTRTCQGCYSESIINTGECCVVTNSSLAEITIIYQVPVSLTSKATKTVKLAPGESFSFAPGAEVIYVSDSNAVNLDCIEIPQTGSRKCYTLKWVTDIEDGGGSDPWKETDVYIKGITYKGVYYPFANGDIFGHQLEQLKEIMETQFAGLFSNITYATAELASYRNRQMMFDTNSSIGDTLFLNIKLFNNAPHLIPAVECETINS